MAMFNNKCNSIFTCAMQREFKGLGLNIYVALRKLFTIEAKKKERFNLPGSIKIEFWSKWKKATWSDKFKLMGAIDDSRVMGALG